MTSYKRIASLKPQPSNNDNRIILSWIGPDLIERTYSVNQQILNNFETEEELKAAVDNFTQQNFGYVLDDVWFHLNRDGTWAVATGQLPNIWPEDEPPIE